jgi:hypothetical protein
MSEQTGDLVMGALMGLFGFVGLFLAAGAQDAEMYLFGLSLAGFAVLFLFGLMRRHYDEAEQALPVAPDAATARMAAHD